MLCDLQMSLLILFRIIALWYLFYDFGLDVKYFLFLYFLKDILHFVYLEVSLTKC